jgi:hypothetical protein
MQRLTSVAQGNLFLSLDPSVALSAVSVSLL